MSYAAALVACGLSLLKLSVRLLRAYSFPPFEDVARTTGGVYWTEISLNYPMAHDLVPAICRILSIATAD
jgi:hypothetical protein